MKIKPYSKAIKPEDLLNVRNQMRKHFNPEGIKDSQTFESYIKPWDRTDPKRDFLVVEDDKGNIVGWGGLFKSSKFWSGIGIFISPALISSNLPIELFDNIKILAESQKLTDLRFDVYGAFKTLRDALDERGIQSRSGSYTLIQEKSDITPPVTIPEGISLKNSSKAEHLTVYAETVNDAFREYASWQNISKEDLEDLELDLYESGYKESIHYYAYDDQKQVGVIHSAIHKPDQNDKKGLIVRLGVIPSHRHQGIGNALLGKAIHWLWKKGCSKIELDVIAENESALKLYKKWGFKEIKDKTVFSYTINPSKKSNKKNTLL
ncbi:MAG: GNAT family N-acetyltransferase [Candidatus Hodarchaeota archaeon]